MITNSLTTIPWATDKLEGMKKKKKKMNYTV